MSVRVRYAPLAGAAHQPCTFVHAMCLVTVVERHLERPRHVDDAGRSKSRAVEDGPAGWLGDGRKDFVDVGVIFNSLVK